MGKRLSLLENLYEAKINFKEDSINGTIEINGKIIDFVVGDDQDPIRDRLKRGDTKAAANKARDIAKARKNAGDTNRADDLERLAGELDSI